MKIGILGFGRFGQTLSSIFKNQHQVFVWNKSDKKRIADDMGVNWSKLEEVVSSDIIFLSVPISSIKNVLKEIKQIIKEGTIVADVCSVKSKPCEWMAETLSDIKVEIVGTHPMFGPDSIKNGLKGKQVVVCPVRISKEKLGILTDILKNLKLDVITTTPEDHDRQTAESLALVHFIGRGLDLGSLDKKRIRTLGFNRLLKVGETVRNDTWQLFQDMNRYNPYAKNVRLKFINRLLLIEKGIQGGIDEIE